VKKTVYIETTIPSFYYNERTAPEIVVCSKWTRQWWDLHRKDFDCCTSDVVLDELDNPRNQLRAEKLSLVEGLRLLFITPAVIETAEIYIRRFVMPRDPTGDALHLALASHYHCDLLLTWNCQHLANEEKMDHIVRVNTLLNLRTPRIVTPLELLGGPDVL
jgi:predicted nucleic acid-binding protein